jgi:hypothetical protein
MKMFIRIIFVSIFVSSCFPLFAEYIFLKDGSILEAKVLSETNTQMKVSIDGQNQDIPRNKILRVLFDAEFKKFVYLKKTDGKTVEGYIVDQDSENYTIREKLDSPAEYPVDKKDIVAVSKEKLVSRGVYYGLGIIPGGAQFYVKKDLKGGLFLGGSIVSCGFFAYSYADYKKKKKDYNNLGRNLPQKEYDDKHDAWTKSSKMALYSLILAGTVYAANWVDVVFFSAPDFNTKSEVPKKAYLDLHIGEPLAVGRGSSPILSARDMPVSVGLGMSF